MTIEEQLFELANKISLSYNNRKIELVTLYLTNKLSDKYKDFDFMSIVPYKDITINMNKLNYDESYIIEIKEFNIKIIFSIKNKGVYSDIIQLSHGDEELYHIAANTMYLDNKTLENPNRAKYNGENVNYSNIKIIAEPEDKYKEIPYVIKKIFERISEYLDSYKIENDVIYDKIKDILEDIVKKRNEDLINFCNL